MKLYFASEPGASEMTDVGQRFYQAAAVSREKEQSMVRIRLCSDGPAPEECGNLSDQVQQIMADNVDNEELFCSAYGLGPAGLDYPKCGGSSSRCPGDGDSSSSSGTGISWFSSSARSNSQKRAAVAFFAFVVSVVL